MTDKQIVDTYKYAVIDGYGDSAIEIAASVSHVTTQDILDILHKHNLAANYKTEKRKEPMEKRMDGGTKAAIIKDYNEGMTCKEIGERYGMNPKVVYNDLRKWDKKGLVVMRTPSKPVHTPQTKKEPASAATETSSCANLTTTSISPQADNVKEFKFGNAVERMILLQNFAINTFAGSCDDFEITGVLAKNIQGVSEVGLMIDGVDYSLSLREVHHE